MIVKIKKEKGWSYFECDRFETGITNWENGRIFGESTEFILQPDIKRSEGKDGQPPYQLTTIAMKHGDKYMHVVTDRVAYLLNDQGNTIDKLS